MFKKFVILLYLASTFLTQFIYAYPHYQETTIDAKNLRSFPESCGHGAYLMSTVIEKIDKVQVGSIFEIGSRDALDAIRLSEHYKSHVYAFECNPECIVMCKHNAEQTPNVTLVEKAVWDEEGTIEFFPVIPEANKIRDPGSSSCFPLTPEKLTSYSQTKIKVPAIRLDQWMMENGIDHVDLICMDTQGATLKILQGMGSFLEKTKYIITECEVSQLYEGECLLPELTAFLEEKGFKLVPTDMSWDYLFINERL